MSAEFRHEALLYAGDDEFVEGAASFIGRGLEADEPILVVVSAAKIELLRAALGDGAERVHFADMAGVGENPARIIPAWRRFVDDCLEADRGLWGIGEPIWADRSPAELVECQLHESLLNQAFADVPGFHLLCPYDTSALPPAVIEEAYHSHPHIAERDVHWESYGYRGENAAAQFAAPLPAPPPQAEELGFESGTLDSVRRYLSHHAGAAGIGTARTDDLLLAVNEVATNSMGHGGGRGTVRAWQDEHALICDVRDSGHIDQPLVGRERPAEAQIGGWGLWVANQLCELVQVRSSPGGSIVRLHMQTAAQ